MKYAIAICLALSVWTCAAQTQCERREDVLHCLEVYGPDSARRALWVWRFTTPDGRPARVEWDVTLTGGQEPALWVLLPDEILLSRDLFWRYAIENDIYAP